MPSSDFYWSRSLITGFGKMWFPLCLQEVSSTGGGASLLGSVVEELSSGIFGWGEHYPAPYTMTTPRLILSKLSQLQAQLGISGNLVIDEQLAPPAETMKVNKKDSLKAGVGPFPSLPASLNLDIDYSRMSEVVVAFGGGAKLSYIPTDYLGRLYKHFQGDSSKVAPSLAIRIDDNYIVDQILVANSFTITFTSESDFDAAFNAKLAALNSIPGANANVTIDRQSNRSVTAQIRGANYLVAFKVIDWDDLG